MKVFFNQQQPIQYKPNLPAFRSAKPIKQLSNDVFVRTDFLSQPSNKILSSIKHSLKNIENYIGRGGSAEVYRIENTNYCVRVPLDATKKMYERFTHRVSKEDKINHTVAKLGEGATIMPIIEGYTFCSREITNSDAAKMVEEMPIEAFKKLFMQIYTAESTSDLRFDSGWKNIIINPKERTLTAIDFWKPTEDAPKNRSEILSCIFSALGNTPMTTLEQQRILAGKLFLTGISILSEHPEIKPEECGFNKLLNGLEDKAIIDNRNYVKVFRKNLKKIDFGAEKIIKALVKQLFGVESNA